ncbi:exodeoxyribonuclease I, partial [Porticoccaceae bacterium]|nr:exodeoxyribonuclease I [Porticoccaceae bacterium]
WQRLNSMDLSDKLQLVFREQTFPPKSDAEQQLYGGFLPNQDKGLLDEVRRATARDFSQQQFYFADQRYNQLLFSYRARYFPESLTAEEQQTWLDSCRWRLTDEQSGYLTLQQNRKTLDELLADTSLSDNKRGVLQALESWSQSVAERFALN